MRAAVLSGPRQTEMVSTTLEAVPSGHLRVAVEGSGVCGSNLPVWEGRPWFSYPLEPGAPGHEAWGRVVEAGPGVDSDRWSEGIRCTFLHDNAFVDVVDVPVDCAVALPAVLDAAPFPGEALGCGWNVAARSGFESGQRVAVVGTGFLGALVVGLAASAGAEVVAISRRPFALELARKMGAGESIQYRSIDDTESDVLDVTGGELCDVVVEAVGAQGPLDLAGRLTQVRGRLVIAGFHQDGARTADIQLWNWRGIDVVNAHERSVAIRRRGIEEAVEAISAGRIDPTPLYTHEYELDRLAEAMDAMVERPDGFMKALVVT